jgi:hypothetical protein
VKSAKVLIFKCKLKHFIDPEKAGELEGMSINNT